MDRFYFVDRDSYKESFSNFLQRLIWDTNLLDGFSKEDINEIKKSIMEDDNFLNDIMLFLCEKVENHSAVSAVRLALFKKTID